MRIEQRHGRSRLVDGSHVLLEACGAVELSGGSIIRTTEPGMFDFVVTLDAVNHGYELRVAVRNGGRVPVVVERLLPLLAEGGLAGVPLARLHVSQTGWQSWSRTHLARPFAPNAESAPPPIRSPFLPGRSAGSMVSPWMAVLDWGGEAALLLGFLEARRFNSGVEVFPTGQGYTLSAWLDVESRVLEPGAVLHADPLFVAWGEEAQLQAWYAGHVAAAMGARVGDVPSGWCSWYQFGLGVTESDIQENLRALAEGREVLPLGLVQIDDGYETEVGDWLVPKPTFASGMRAQADAVRDHGLTPGLWLAPFLLSERAQTYREHPEWVVRDAAGAPINALDNWGSRNYCLDTTHPAALRWIESVVRSLAQEWGFDYLKLDFLYAAAVRGVRHERTATAIEAYRRGMVAVRRAAGPRFLLGCGAPLLPSVGLVDGMRIGSDVAPYWKREGSDVGGPALANATRSTLVRGWMHGRWWANDPDCVLVREQDSELTEEEVRAWASVVALSGGMLMVGDDLTRLPPERIEGVLRRLLPPVGQAPLVLGPHADDIPQRIRLDVQRPWGRWWIVGLANWSDEPRVVSADCAALGLPSGEHLHAVDLWSGTYVPTFPDEPATLPPHALRLLAVRRRLDRPHVLSTTGHLLGDAVDVLAERWDAASGTLELQARPGASGDVLIYVPPAWRASPVVRLPLRSRLTVALRTVGA